MKTRLLIPLAVLSIGAAVSRAQTTGLTIFGNSNPPRFEVMSDGSYHHPRLTEVSIVSFAADHLTLQCRAPRQDFSLLTTYSGPTYPAVVEMPAEQYDYWREYFVVKDGKLELDRIVQAIRHEKTDFSVEWPDDKN